MNQILTKRLKLRNITLNDTNQIFELFSDKNLLKFTDNVIHKTLNDTLLLIEKYKKESKNNKSIRLVICLKDSDNIIGFLSIYNIDWTHKFASVGCFLSKKHQKNGFMIEAYSLVITHSFNNLKLNRLEAQIFVENTASINLFTNLSFIKEGRLRQNFMINNKLEDSYMYALLKEDWKK